MLQENATVSVTLMGTNATHVRLDGILSLHVMVRSDKKLQNGHQIVSCSIPFQNVIVTKRVLKTQCVMLIPESVLVKQL